VPPIAQAVPGYAFESWFGLLAPAGTPAPVVERINAAMATVLASATIRERLAAQGVEPRPLTPDAFAKLIAEDYETMSRVVKVVGKVE